MSFINLMGLRSPDFFGVFMFFIRFPQKPAWGKKSKRSAIYYSRGFLARRFDKLVLNREAPVEPPTREV